MSTAPDSDQQANLERELQEALAQMQADLSELRRIQAMTRHGARENLREAGVEEARSKLANLEDDRRD